MNLTTLAMEKLTKMLLVTDAKLKEMGKEPYGQRKATAKEQREKYENLTEGQLYEMIEKHGLDDTNDWLYRMEQGGK